MILPVLAASSRTSFSWVWRLPKTQPAPCMYKITCLFSSQFSGTTKFTAIFQMCIRDSGVSGETTCDHEKILTVGLKGYMDECRENIAKTVSACQEDQEKINYWRACIIQCQGLITYAHRMAEEAERQAAECSDEKRKKELLTIAENCRVVPENPPKTFQQALQMIWFVHVYFHIEVCTCLLYTSPAAGAEG